jgi:hypothetical protein
MIRTFAATVALALALTPAAVRAQAAPPVAAAPEPARLAAAQALIGKIMPVDRRDAMVDQMIRPMIENMRGAMSSSPQFESLRSEDPKFGPAFDDFVKNELEHSLATTKAAMPALFDAMARAYARRFTLDQIRAISDFFDTPAGRAFAEQTPTLMSDPDVLAAQRAMMTDAMKGMQARVKAFAEKATAAEK